jgi:hypothetical protein
VDLADPADHGEMAVAVADISLRARDAGGQPLAVLHGNKPVLAAVPDLDGHPDVAEIEPPAGQVRRSVIPPALVARGEGDLVGLGEPSGQVPGQDLGVDGREEALELFSELLRRGRENLLPVLAQIAARCQLTRSASGPVKAWLSLCCRPGSRRTGVATAWRRFR